jgi:hypothetical protein
MWLWPVAILLSFPIGGLIADLVINGVDSVGTAIIGGLIAGAIIGAAEWFALRQWVSWLWIPATSVGMAAGLAAGAAIVDYGIGRGDVVVIGVATGVGVGVLQRWFSHDTGSPARSGGRWRTRLSGASAGS